MEKILEKSDRKEKILVITGDGAFGERLEMTLDAAGYDVTLVKNGVEGLKNIYDLLPHLVILDVLAPGSDGYDILAKKQAEPMLAKIPVFLMSGQGLPIDMRRIPRDSVTEFIMALHADPKEILSKVNRHFGRAIVKDAAPASAGLTKVFWIEDDKLIGNILGKKLESSNFDVIHAKTADEALSGLSKVIPDIILLDIILPGMNGLDLLQKVRQDERLKKVPVIVLSNLSKPSDIEKAKILGAGKFLVKAAVSLDQIVSEIRATCR